ncbi:MAG: GldG family protein [Gemmataceae bacterium]|nr:GldG family protein [Gemmataceae bacterium]
MPETGGFVDRLARDDGRSARTLVGIGALLGAGSAFLFYRAMPAGPAALGADSIGLTFALWVAGLAIAAIGAGSIRMASDPDIESATLSVRTMLLALTAGVGAATFFLGIALLYQWADPLFRLIREGDREEAWKVFVPLVATVGGLGIMFAGLQAVRSAERRDQTLRRAIYGFNAFLTGFLLFAVLLVGNVIAYLKLPATIDTTQSAIYSISDRSKQILADIDRPTRLLVFMEGVDPEVQALVNLCREHQPKITVENLTTMQPNRIRELAKTFPQLTENTEGILIVYGDEKAENAAFIRSRDLITEDADPGSREIKRKFMGELKLMNELSFLMGGKDKPVVYFSQGNGEADINDRSKPQGYGNIVDKLQRRNFEVKPLKLDALGTTVPDDCRILVIAGPKQTLPPAAVDAVRAYLEKGGKLVALFDIDVNRGDKEIPLTGLEGTLAAAGIDVSRERVQTVPTENTDIRSMDEALVRVDPASAGTPLGGPFKNMVFQFFGCRVVRPAKTPPAPGGFRATPLLSTSDQTLVWTETDPQVNGLQTLQLMQRDPKARERLSPAPLPVAMTASESPRGMPGQAPPAEKPRIAVFGDATFLVNAVGGSRSEGAAVMFDLFAGTLDWLRERPTNIGIEPRVAATYDLTPGAMNNETTLKFLPLLVGVVGVFGLGLGVWLVRRQ